MTPVAARSERTALMPLRLLAALHVLFFLGFVASLLAAWGRL